MRRILITAALPYANGDIHLGHLVEYIQADIWARFQTLRGNECYFVCADDAHGTPIMLRAEAEKTTPEELIERMRENHLRDFCGFHVNFNRYHSTHSSENEKLSIQMFRRLQQGGCIAEREIQQLYDDEKNMFLPDRYVRGECPKCGAADQYGDSCEKCGAAYASAELKNPASTLSNTKPSLRSSLHYFLRLNTMQDELSKWTQEHIDNPAGGEKKIPRLQKEAVNKMREWLSGDLRDWDISRDAPYFGFRIPDIEAEKYFYVWLDAPIGYMASFENFCCEHKLNFDDFWNADSENKTELYHFIGKDILYFHALFWPAMLQNSGYRRPTRIFAHGFLTVNGEKMSKSRGTFITAAHYLQCGLNPECLRYYYACKLNDRIEDLDLSLNDFCTRVNGDLVGKLVNIPSRVAGFLHRFFNGTLDDSVSSGEDYDAAVRPALAVATEVAEAYENRRYQEAMRLIMQATDAVNAHIDFCAPWLLAKDEAQREKLHAVCSAAMRAFHLLMILLKPTLPNMAKQVEEMLNDSLSWGKSLHPLPAGHTICAYKHLLKRMSDSNINALIQPSSSQDASSPPPKAADTATAGIATIADIIAIEDFAKIDLRVAVVTDAADVEGADKLLRLALDVGDGRIRQVFSGIKQYYNAEDLIGRRVIYLSNLKTRTMRFGESEGMVLAAADGNGLWLAEVSNDAPLGTKIK